MRNLTPFTARESRQVMELINNQYGCKLSPDYYFVQHKDGNVYILSRDAATVDLDSLRVNSVGSYLCEPNDDSTMVRLSIEGSQLVGPHAVKNVLELSDADYKEWAKGHEIPITSQIEEKLSDTDGYVIIKNSKNDYYGVGRSKKGVILNFTPKNRRIAISA